MNVHRCSDVKSNAIIKIIIIMRYIGIDVNFIYDVRLTHTDDLKNTKRTPNRNNENQNISFTFAP